MSNINNTHFDAFVKECFDGSTYQAAKTLQMDRDTIKALRTGQTRLGNDYPLPYTVQLAMCAYLKGLEPGKVLKRYEKENR